MGCGCGGKKFSSNPAAKSQVVTSQRVVASSPVPPQVQQAMYAKRTVQAAETVYSRPVTRKAV